MSEVIEYPEDPLLTFPTSDPNLRYAAFGSAGVVTFVIDDAQEIVLLTDVTWAG